MFARICDFPHAPIRTTASTKVVVLYRQTKLAVAVNSRHAVGRNHNLSGLKSLAVQPLAVVVPTLNEERYIVLCLNRLLSQLHEQDRIYVADGGSKDRTVPLAYSMAKRDPRIIVVDNPRRTQAAAVNLVAAQLAGRNRLLIRADAHNDYPRGFIRCVVKAYEEQGPASVVVRVETIGRTCFQKAAAAAQNSRLGNGGSPHRTQNTSPGWIDHGRHALFDLTFFREVGGYDETFRANEDAELDLRIAKAGGRIWLCPDPPVRYFPRSTPLALAKQYFHYGWGRYRSSKKHNIPLKTRQLLTVSVMTVNLACLFLSLAWLPLLVLPCMYALVCLCWGTALAIKAGNRCVGASGIAAIIMHTAWSTGYTWACVGGLMPGASSDTQ